MRQPPPVVLTIAGFDPSSGAGITADIKTIAANGCYGVAAITALTVQSTSGVRRVIPIEVDVLRETLEELAADMPISAVHIGMLGSGGLASAIADFLDSAKLRSIVLDPVLRSTSGADLIDQGGKQILTNRLLPLATVITPNADEAAVLTGIETETIDEMIQAGRKFLEMGANHVLITGGHLGKPTDVLCSGNHDTQTFEADQVNSDSTHGTGCALSTAIACHLAHGRPLAQAIQLAKVYVTGTIANGYRVGKGINPVNHMCQADAADRAEGKGSTRSLISGS